MKTLIVEDNPSNQKLISSQLSVLGYKADLASNGREALKMTLGNDYALIITDCNMPIMDGLKLVKRVRSDPVHKDTPIVIITTESAPHDRDRAMALGANAYIEKPIQGPRVIRAVRRLLEV